jgi:hypothetical protein
MVICIPSGITEVEKRAVRDSAEHAGAKEVYFIHEPMAAAIGIGIDVEEPMGNMIIDIGGGTSVKLRLSHSVESYATRVFVWLVMHSQPISGITCVDNIIFSLESVLQNELKSK